MVPNHDRRESDEQQSAWSAERRSQVRALLVLAGLVLVFLLLRARPLHLFGPGWWRL